MPCYHPITAYRSRDVPHYKSKDKWKLVFNPTDGFLDMPVQVPCGQCVGCRLERSRQWAVRCVHEASMHPANCFLTLTYDPKYLPRSVNLETGEIGQGEYPSLNKRHMVLFLKRLRKKYGEGIRFFQCGEYGEKLQRPHHHVILFNHDFTDKKYACKKRGNKIYNSQSLAELWPYGNHSIGSVTFESVAYTARYILKKVNGDKADTHYEGRTPEYITMSRKPGIGREWFEKFQSDVYPQDKIILRGGLMAKPPAYYDSLYDMTNPVSYRKIKKIRLENARLSPDNTPDRLKIREMCKKSSLKQLQRNVEKGIL